MGVRAVATIAALGTTGSFSRLTGRFPGNLLEHEPGFNYGPHCEAGHVRQVTTSAPREESDRRW
jgi:hypothetical protein